MKHRGPIPVSRPLGRIWPRLLSSTAVMTLEVVNQTIGSTQSMSHTSRNGEEDQDFASMPNER